jgi:hypothetical protein
MIASGAGSAVEGAILAAPRALTEEALGDHDKAAETLLYGAGGGALFGLVGPLGGKIKEGFKSAFSGLAAVEKEAAGVAKAEGKSAIGKMADDQAFRSIASNNASLKIAEKDARAIGGAIGVGETLNELGLVRKFREAPADYAERLGGGEKRVGREDRRAPEESRRLPSRRPRSTPIFARIEKDVMNPLAQKVGMEPVEKKLEPWVESLREDGGRAFVRARARCASGSRRVDLRGEGFGVPGGRGAEEGPPHLRSEFEKQGDAAAKAAGKDFLVPWKRRRRTSRASPRRRRARPTTPSAR